VAPKDLNRSLISSDLIQKLKCTGRSVNTIGITTISRTYNVEVPMMVGVPARQSPEQQGLIQEEPSCRSYPSLHSCSERHMTNVDPSAPD
jgi:hypothetical protein